MAISSTLPTKQPDKTRAGNYFVSNYPPYSFWKPGHLDSFVQVLDEEPVPTPLGLYVHIPYCRKRCHFCYFRVYTGAKSQEIRTYVDATLQELTHYSDKPFVGGRPLNFVYFGGGTPSYLSTSQLKTLTDGLKDQLPWDQAEEITFECEPGTLNEKKLEFIRSLGVTRLSLGVENFDAHILEINGRAHRTEEIDRAYSFARSVEFPQINIDLIAGMMDETEENWKACVQRAMELDPDSITVYQMEIPYNTTIYKQMQEAGRVTAPVADWETKRRWVKEAFAEFEKAGYHIGSAYTAVKKDREVEFIYRDRLWEGADLLSLGVASFGHIQGIHYQNHHDMDRYLEDLERDTRPVFRAYPVSEEEALIREFALQLKRGEVAPGYFERKFKVDVLEKYDDAITHLRHEGYLEQSDDPLRLTRDGLLVVDLLLPEFFLPEHRVDRIV